MLLTVCVCLAICLIMMAFVLFKGEIKIKKVSLSTFWIVALIGAVILICTGLVDFNKLLTRLTENTAVNPLKILVLFVSMTALSVFLDEAHFFRYLAALVIKKAKCSQKKLFFLLYVTVSILTVFTSNDVIVLTFTPFICYFVRRAHVNALPYLVCEFVAANTWSMFLIIGNPTNIYLASFFGVDFWGYALTMLLPTVFAGLTSLGCMFLLFRKKLSVAMSLEVTDTPPINKPFTIVGIVVLATCTVLLTVASYIGLEMFAIAFFSALTLFLVCIIFGKKGAPKVLNLAKRLPLSLIPFMLSMFVIVSALEQCGFSKVFGDFLNCGKLSALTYGAGSALVSNIINNIPMSVLFASALSVSGANVFALYASVIGSNIGALISPLGALAGIMFTNMLKKYHVKFSFLDFVKTTGLIALPTLIVAVTSLYLVI